MKVKERIEKLREAMKAKGINAYIIPSSDPHQSEYVPEYFKARQWISGFTGSAGVVVVTEKEAGLFTDGRYFIQAEKQLEGSGISLFRVGEVGVPTYIEWLKEIMPKGSKVGFDGKVIAIAVFNSMEKIFSKKKIELVSEFDLITPLWVNRPSLPKDKIYQHEVIYAGKTRAEKLSDVRNEMKKLGGDYYLLTALEDVAWLYNIRGNDVTNIPVVISYSVISLESAWIFIDEEKVSAELKAEFEKDNIKILNYNTIDSFLSGLEKDKVVIFDANKANVWLNQNISSEIERVEEQNITTKLKALKNEVEVENLRKCHVKDCAALTKFLHWIDKNVGKEKITEVTADDKLYEFRAQGENFKGRSFDTIAGYKDHGAMMHYKATEESAYELKREGFFLVDSGGQYLDGTTDITRTIALGKLSEEERIDFTLVLKGHIALTTAKFLYGTTGSALDILARKPLWDRGIDYKCGTGHGVGYLLSVHEGPQNISQHPSTVKLEKGMILTNEPGVYKAGMHGIRTENTLLVVEAEKTQFGGQFMRFEIISYCPIDLDGIIVEMLTEEERDWLNRYHKTVYFKLSPYLNEEENEWLKTKTREI